MYMQLLQRLAQRLGDRNILQKEQIPIFVYGLDSLLSSVFSYTLMLLLALLMGQLADGALWILSYTLLRQCAGGYHATTQLRCQGLSLLMTALSLLCIRWIPPTPCLALAALCIPMVWWLAPVEHANHPLNPKRRARQWRLARIIVCAEALICVACCLWLLPALAPIAVGMAVSTAMMTLAAILYRDAQPGVRDVSAQK